MELRLGDATANPYLIIAGVLAAAYLGIRDNLAAPAPLPGYGYDPERPDLLPSISPALDAFEADEDFVDLLGQRFAERLPGVQTGRLRFARWVTDWEFREYAYHL